MKCDLTMSKTPSSKSFWSLVGKLFLILTLFICGTSVHAANTSFTYQGYTYTVNNDGTSVTLINGNNPSKDVSVIVPNYAYDSSTQKSYAVTAIAEEAFKAYEGTYVVIGDNVETIGGKAFEHFGEGYSATLILGKSVSTLGEKTFEHFGEKQNKPCKAICLSPTPASDKQQTFEHVKGTTFYVIDETAYNSYVAADYWKTFDKNNNSVGNSYQYPLPCNYETTSDKWVTIMLPDALSSTLVETYFGNGTKVAELKSANWTESTSTYNLTFTTVSEIAANTPYFIKPGNKDAHYISLNSFSEDATTKDKSVDVTNATDKKAHMVGNGSSSNYTLQTNEFYFRNNDEGMNFYMTNGKSFVKPTKCYFKITESSSETAVMAKMAMSLDDDATTGISETTVKKVQKLGIYSIDGQYRGNDLNSLPQGLYIVNGKKVIK